MPQIAAKSGFSGLFLSHGLPPHTDRILYIAPDGTGIKAYAPFHYGRCRRLFHDATDYARMCENEKEIEEILAEKEREDFFRLKRVKNNVSK